MTIQADVPACNQCPYYRQQLRDRDNKIQELKQIIVQREASILSLQEQVMEYLIKNAQLQNTIKNLEILLKSAQVPLIVEEEVL